MVRLTDDTARGPIPFAALSGDQLTHFMSELASRYREDESNFLMVATFKQVLKFGSTRRMMALETLGVSSSAYSTPPVDSPWHANEGSRSAPAYILSHGNNDGSFQVMSHAQVPFRPSQSGFMIWDTHQRETYRQWRNMMHALRPEEVQLSMQDVISRPGYTFLHAAFGLPPKLDVDIAVGSSSPCIASNQTTSDRPADPAAFPLWKLIEQISHICRSLLGKSKFELSDSLDTGLIVKCFEERVSNSAYSIKTVMRHAWALKSCLRQVTLDTVGLDSLSITHADYVAGKVVLGENLLLVVEQYSNAMYGIHGFCDRDSGNGTCFPSALKQHFVKFDEQISFISTALTGKCSLDTDDFRNHLLFQDLMFEALFLRDLDLEMSLSFERYAATLKSYLQKVNLGSVDLFNVDCFSDADANFFVETQVRGHYLLDHIEKWCREAYGATVGNSVAHGNISDSGISSDDSSSSSSSSPIEAV